MIAKKFRKSIIQSAVQGKFSFESTSKSTIVELLNSIRQEKESKILKKEIRRRKLKAAICEEEYPYNIPSSWSYVRLGELGDFRKGPFGSALRKSIFVKKSDSSIKVYEQKNAIQKSTELGEYYITSEYYNNKMQGFTVNGGDIIISCAGTIGETYILPEDCRTGIINQALMRVRLYSGINPDFFKYLFEYILNSKGDKKGKGSAIKNIPPFDVLLNFVVGIPTHDEQKLIVEKLDLILPMIDALEKDEIKLEEIMTKFPNNMNASILQAAFHGKLTEQLETDVTIDFIEVDKVNKKVLTQIENPPFDIPKNWVWARLGKFVELTNGKKMSSEKHPYLEVRYLRGKKDKVYKMSGRYIEEKSRVILVDGENSGEVFTIDENGYMGSTFRLLNISDEILWPYLNYFLISNKTLLRNNKTGSAIPHLNKGLFLNLLVPVPPLEEQKRIVNRIGELLPLVEILRKD